MPYKDPEKRKAKAAEIAKKWAENPENKEKLREATRRWRARNPEKAREKVREWRAKNPDVAKEIEARRMADPVRGPKRLEYARERMRGLRQTDPRAVWSAKLVSLFGITADDYDAISSLQGHVCAICKQPEKTVSRGVLRRLAIDHCAEKGHVRGLLCGNCNRAIGQLRHNQQSLESAIQYLLNPPARKVLKS